MAGMASDSRFAVLIDADNVSGKYIKLILDEISKDGVATYKRIYGDWTNPALVSWKSVLLDYSVMPIQQYSYTTGKNSTDSAMIIDAMDILYSGKVEGFCLVSSDSDFTRLAARLRESGMTVIGMGESKTPNSFIAACNKFKYLDILSAADEEEGEEELGKRSSQKKAPARRAPPRRRRRKSKRRTRNRKTPRGKRPRSLWRNPAPACAPSAGPCAPSCGRTLTRTTGSSWGRWGTFWTSATPTSTCATSAFPSSPPS